MGLAYKDFGTYEAISCHYPLYGERARPGGGLRRMRPGHPDLRHRHRHVPGGQQGRWDPLRVCSEPYSAQLSRMHNDTNMLALGARVVGVELAKMIARIWLQTAFEGGRHQNRVDMITAIEQGGTAQDA